MSIANDFDSEVEKFHCSNQNMKKFRIFDIHSNALRSKMISIALFEGISKQNSLFQTYAV